MGDLDLMGSFGLDSSGGISELDNIASALSDIDRAAASAGGSIADGMNLATSSFSELRATATEAYSAIESGADQAVGAASRLGEAANEAAAALDRVSAPDLGGASGGLDELAIAAKGAGEAANEANAGFSLLDGINLGAGIAAVEGMVAAVQGLIGALDESVAKFGEVEAASTQASMRSSTANTTEDFLAASKEIQGKSLELAPVLGVNATDLTSILSTFSNTVGGAQNVTAQMLQPIANLSLIEQKNAADIYSSEKLLGKQFGTDDYGNISDIAAKAYARTGLGVGDMGRTGTMLSGLGMSLEEAFATVGTLTTSTGYGSNLIAKALSNAESEIAKSSSESKTDKSGKVTVKYEGLGEEMSLAGLDIQAEKAKGLKDALVDMYQSGIDISEIFKGTNGTILEQYAAQQSQIESLTDELITSTGAAGEMGNAIGDTLKTKTEMATIAVDTAKTAFGSLFEEPAKEWQVSVATMANATTEFINDIKNTDIETAIENVTDRAVTYLESLDYKEIGQNLLNWLEGGWNTATDLFGAFLASDTELTGAFSAIKDVFGPTFDSIFTTLKIGGLEAVIALGEGFVSLENAIGGGLTGAVFSVIGALADLAGAADVALGGSLSKIINWADGSGSAEGAGTPTTGEKIYVSETGAQTKESEVEEYRASKGYKVDVYPLGVSGWGQDAGGRTEPGTGQILDVLNEMYEGTTFKVASGEKIGLDAETLHTLSVNPATGKEYTDAEIEKNQKAYLASPEGRKDSGADKTDLGANLKEVGIQAGTAILTVNDLKMGRSTAANIARESTKENVGAIPEEDRTDYDKASLAAAENSGEILAGIDKKMGESVELGKTGIEKDGNAAHDLIISLMPLEKWTDKTFDENNILRNQLAALIAARDAIKDTGIVTKESKNTLEKIDGKITDTENKIVESIANAAEGVKEVTSLFYGEFQGATKDYAKAMEQSDADIAKSAQVNWNRGIATVGSMTGYTSQYGELATAAGLTPEHPIVTNMKALIEIDKDKLAKAKDDVSGLGTDVKAITSDPLIPDVDTTEAKASVNDLAKTVEETPLALKLGIDTGIFKGTGSSSSVDGNTVSATAWTTLQAPASQQSATQINQLIGPLNLIRTAQQATTTATRQISQDVKNVSALDRTMISATGTAISANVISSATSINATISQSAANIMEVLREVMGSSGGAGGYGSGSSSEGMTSGGMQGMSLNDFPQYADGGFIDRPTLTWVAEAGEGEYIIPESNMQNLVRNLGSSVNVAVGFDISGAASELESALSSLSIPTIQVPISIAFDASEIQAAIHQALAIELDNLRWN